MRTAINNDIQKTVKITGVNLPLEYSTVCQRYNTMKKLSEMKFNPHIIYSCRKKIKFIRL